jgi:taurine transport system permease protein
VLDSDAVKGRLVRGRRRGEKGSAAASRSAEPTSRGLHWLSALSVLLVLVAWWFIHAFDLVPEVLLPGPGEVVATFLDIVRDGYRETTLWGNSASTLWRCGAGFILACVTGVPLGLAMGYRPRIKAACNYIVQFMRPLPPLSYLILLILWLGTGDASKIALLYLTAFPIIASSAMAGVWTTKEQRLQAAR